jgi:hypothetical protein
MWLIAPGTSSAGLLAGCCVDLLVHALRYTNRRIALSFIAGPCKLMGDRPTPLSLNTKTPETGVSGVSIMVTSQVT